MERRFVQLDLSVAFDRISHCCLLHKLDTMGVGGQVLSIVSEFLSDREQSVRLDGKVSASVDVFSRVPQGSTYGLCCLYCTPPSSFTLLGTTL